eukprot:1161671-Pelagomonas_calceolata.AAC.23
MMGQIPGLAPSGPIMGAPASKPFRHDANQVDGKCFLGVRSVLQLCADHGFQHHVHALLSVAVPSVQTPGPDRTDKSRTRTYSGAGPVHRQGQARRVLHAMGLPSSRQLAPGPPVLGGKEEGRWHPSGVALCAAL